LNAGGEKYARKSVRTSARRVLFAYGGGVAKGVKQRDVRSVCVCHRYAERQRESHERGRRFSILFDEREREGTVRQFWI